MTTEQEIIDLYTQTYSVSQVLKQVEYGRAKVVKILKEANVYEGLTGPNYLAMKVKKHRETMQDKYGVDNISQIREPKLIRSNKIEYDNLSFEDDLREYTHKVRNYSKNLVTRRKSIPLADRCYYTGIEFADLYKGEINPNDPYKRTVDHKHPIILCYFDGWSVEQAGGEKNIVFVLRYINSVKSNTTHESFLPIVAGLKERLKSEKIKVISG